jgi:hypothetical protein
VLTSVVFFNALGSDRAIDVLTDLLALRQHFFWHINDGEFPGIHLDKFVLGV